MKKASPFRLRRNRPTKLRLSSVIVVALIGSWMFQCMCGPGCGADTFDRVHTAPLVADSGCCSSCTPVEKSRSPELPKDDCTCCLDDMQDYKLTEVRDETRQSAPEKLPVLVEVMSWLPEPPPFTWVVQKCPPPGGAPAYLRFEILLI